MHNIYDKDNMNDSYKSCMLYNFAVKPDIRRISLSQFRAAIREIVHSAENGEPTILTHYHRDVAAIIPMTMFDAPPVKTGEKTSTAQKRSGIRHKAS